MLTANRKDKRNERKQRRKDELQRETELLALVKAAKEQSDPLETLAAFRTLKCKDLTATLTCTKASATDDDKRRWAFELTKNNMQEMYKDSEWGWNDANKQKEMNEDDMWYLIASVDDNPCAVATFKFDLDYGDPVLYCYEIQLEERVRRRGLGRKLTQVMELLAFRASMLKVVLTVFKSNDGAVEFFRSVGYTVDETSPEDTLFDSYHYVIMSKLNKWKNK